MADERKAVHKRVEVVRKPSICVNCFHKAVCAGYENMGVVWCEGYANATDVVEVVRCKDCVHYDKGENDSEAWEYCKVLAKDVFDDFFCKLGKRRANDGD